MSFTKEYYKLMIQNLRNCYKEYEDRFSPKGIEVSTYHTPVNFEEAMQCPIHRWLAYKEGFSPSFVKEFILKPVGGINLAHT